MLSAQAAAKAATTMAASSTERDLLIESPEWRCRRWERSGSSCGSNDFCVGANLSVGGRKNPKNFSGTSRLRGGSRDTVAHAVGDVPRAGPVEGVESALELLAVH